jgi:uncharacterized membrane protein
MLDYFLANSDLTWITPVVVFSVFIPALFIIVLVGGCILVFCLYRVQNDETITSTYGGSSHRSKYNFSDSNSNSLAMAYIANGGGCFGSGNVFGGGGCSSGGFGGGFGGF